MNDIYIEFLTSNETISKDEKDRYDFSRYVENTDDEFYEYEDNSTISSFLY